MEVDEISIYSLQDFLTSSYLITSKDTFYTREQFGQLMAYMGDGLDAVVLPPPAIIAPQVRIGCARCPCIHNVDAALCQKC